MVAQFVNNHLGKKVMPGYQRTLKPVRKDLHPEFYVSPGGTYAICEVEDVINQLLTDLKNDPKIAAKVQSLKEQSSTGTLEGEIVVKYGMDASGDHILTQQGEAAAAHSHCFASMMVYVQLRFKVAGKIKKVHTNKLVNSNWACIPLRLFYHKETDGNYVYFDFFARDVLEVKKFFSMRLCTIDT